MVRFNDACRFYSSKFTNAFVICTFYAAAAVVCFIWCAKVVYFYRLCGLKVFGKTYPVTRNPFVKFLDMGMIFHEVIIKLIYSPLLLECFTFISTESLFIQKFGSDNYFIKYSHYMCLLM